MKPPILVTRNFSDAWVDFLKKNFDVTLWEKDDVADRDWILSNMKGKKGAVVMLTDRVDREFMDTSDSLLAISTMSVGYDHIDVDYAHEKGIIVTNTPDVLTETTADLGMALLLSAARRVSEGDRLVRSGGWKGSWDPHFMLGRDLMGKTIGILGMGRIGRAIASRAMAFGLKVIFHSRSEVNIPGYESVSFDELLRNSDFLMVTVSLNKETDKIIGKTALSRMKPESILINISRGGVVDQEALSTALHDGVIAGAALDVYEKEPLPRGSSLMGLENVILSPHLGSATVETREKMAELAAMNLLEALSGKQPSHQV